MPCPTKTQPWICELSCILPWTASGASAQVIETWEWCNRQWKLHRLSCRSSDRSEQSNCACKLYSANSRHSFCILGGGQSSVWDPNTCEGLKGPAWDWGQLWSVWCSQAHWNRDACKQPHPSQALGLLPLCALSPTASVCIPSHHFQLPTLQPQKWTHTIKDNSYLSSLLCPTQTLPPYRGAGLLHDRCRTWKPIPQEVLQGAQEDHGVQAPFLTKRVRENRVWGKCWTHGRTDYSFQPDFVSGEIFKREFWKCLAVA